MFTQITTLSRYYTIIIGIITLFGCWFICSGAALEQPQQAPCTQQMQEYITTEVEMISIDLQNRLTSITRLLSHQSSPTTFAFACNLNLAKLQRKEERLRRLYYIQRQKHNMEKRCLAGHPEQTWPAVIEAWRCLRDWYGKKLKLLDSFRQYYRLKTGIIPSCHCSAQQKDINHAEIAVAVIDVPVDEIALIGTNMVISYGTPVSKENALWFIPFCLRANQQKTALFVAKGPHSIYQWLVLPFIDSNLELALMKRNNALPQLYQLDETDNKYAYPLPIINHSSE